MKKTTKYYLEAIVSFMLGGLGLYQFVSGWITGSLYFPVKNSRTILVSLTENATGFYTAMVLWAGITVTLLVFGFQYLQKAMKD